MVETDPRQLAFEVLERVEDGAYLDALVGQTLARHVLPERDAALFTRLVYGTLTWKGRLDWTIAGLARRPLARIDAPLRSALRLGLFQITRLDRVPPHAAVHTSVEIAKRAHGRAGASFVNALLRAALRAGGELPLPRVEDEPVRALAVRWSHPEWLVERWLSELGPERTPELLAANDEPAPTVLRIDLRSYTRASAIAELGARGIVAHPTAFSRAGVVIDHGAGAALDLPWAMPQGEASQLVAEMVAPAAGERVADLCAAPGGKTAALAEALQLRLPALSPPGQPGTPGTPGTIVAMDRSRSGMRRVNLLATGAQPRAVTTARADATFPPFADASFDAVLLDAPCSGLGTMRSHPEIRWRRSPAEVSALAATQRRLLSAAADLVRPGGRLVYATCTLLAEENDDVISAFLAERPAWRVEGPRGLLEPQAGVLIDTDGALRTAPDRGDLDGFFAVRLRRAHA
jgi:16S rRNA (cytosine967-C5)-methyltransferase